MLARSEQACVKCGVLKPLDQYHRDARMPGGIRKDCKVCKIATLKAWRKRNPDRVLEHKREWFERHGDKIREKQRARHHANKVHANNKRRLNYQENRDRQRATQRAYYEANRDLWYHLNKRRQAAQMQAIPAWASLDKIRAVYAEAKRITEETGAQHHVDHIVPLVSKHVCGLHCENNLQVLRYDINIAKGNRTWPGKLST